MPWHFVVVDDPKNWQRCRKAVPWAALFLNGAPVAILVLAEESKVMYGKDATIAAILMQVEATDLGLAAVGRCATA